MSGRGRPKKQKEGEIHPATRIEMDRYLRGEEFIPGDPLATRFVQEYLIRHNSTQAAMAIGFNRTDAAVVGRRLINEPLVQTAINDALAKQGIQCRAHRLEVLKYLRAILFFDIRELFSKEDGTPIPPHELDDFTAKIVQGVKWNRDGGYEYRLPDRLKALEMAMAHLGIKSLDPKDMPIDVAKEIYKEMLELEQAHVVIDA